ncbi:hypothetical protein FISHEDRAFT_71340 [Fistulina hepatica ATCC 64428]|nr:hypothetical protein FISHEDRAFT_71340 [Fistulina hepatica ATCC 64428]
MARRDAPNPTPYLTKPDHYDLEKRNSFMGAITTWIRAPGNMSMISAIGLFVGGITAVRTWGDMLVPPS